MRYGITNEFKSEINCQHAMFGRDMRLRDSGRWPNERLVNFSDADVAQGGFNLMEWLSEREQGEEEED